MLSIAQVPHVEAPGTAASKHSSLGHHSWVSSDRQNMVKRRKTEPDCILPDTKQARTSVEHVEQLDFVSSEVTLFVVTKKNAQLQPESELETFDKGSAIKEEFEAPCNEKEETFRDIFENTTDLPSIVIDFLKNSTQVQLTKLASNQSAKLTDETNSVVQNASLLKNSEQIESAAQLDANHIAKDDDHMNDNKDHMSYLKNFKEVSLTKPVSKQHDEAMEQDDCDTREISVPSNHETQSLNVFASSCEKENDDSQELKMSTSILSNTIAELKEVTIEPCPSTSKCKTADSPKSVSNNTKCTNARKPSKTQSKIDRAEKLLKKRDHITRTTRSVVENCSFNFECPPDNVFSNKKVNTVVSTEEDFEDFTCVDSGPPLFVEEPDQTTIAVVNEYEPFNVGIACETYYPSNKDRPYYTTGFPNPPGDNRCWVNATLQALFALPIINKSDSLDCLKNSKLLALLSSIQTFWRKGSTTTNNFDQTFRAFKEELSALDKLYSSKAQQDVSEFIMNLFNFIKTEFDTSIKKSQNSEIENIPLNEQDALKRTQGSMLEANKRLPLAEISTSPRQLRSNNQTCTKPKIESQSEAISNIIDEYFLLYMTENYECDGCKKQRQQKVENLILFIDLPSEDDGSTIKLENMINKTYDLEHRNMTCESCKHDSHSMVTKLKSVPKILTIQVKRYEMTNDGMITKKSTMIEVPKMLKLDSLAINNQDFSHCPVYEPVGIICHIGDNIDSGHYISFAKHQNQWFYYDDAYVNILNEEELFKCIQNNVYVIFYQDTDIVQNTEITVDHKNKKDSIMS